MTAPFLETDEYKFIFERVPRLCIDLVIYSKQGMLLSLRAIKPNENTWHFPGGMMYKGETIEAAAKRIALKETGLEIEIKDSLGHIEFLNEDADDISRHSVSIVLSALVLDGELKHDFQSKELRYFTQMPDNIFPEHRPHIEKYLELTSIKTA